MKELRSLYQGMPMARQALEEGDIMGANEFLWEMDRYLARASGDCDGSFPESATFGWVIGLMIAVALVGCMVVGVVVRHWPRRHE